MSGLKTIGVWVAATIMLAACGGPWHAAPEKIGAPQWSIASPDGWMHMSMQDSEMLSKDGPYLEYILIQSRPLAKGFRFTRQKLNAGMLPNEAAQLIIDNLRSDPHIRQFRLLTNVPAMVGGQPGFKLIYTYQDPHGVTVKTVSCGVIFPEMYFNLRYSATQRHYFNKELPAFNQVLDSLRFAPT